MDRSRDAADADAGARCLSGYERFFWLMGLKEPLNVSVVARVRGTLDEARFRGAVAELARRHPLLRSTIEERADGPWLVPRAEVALPLQAAPRRTLRDWERMVEEALAHPFIAPGGPLARVDLLRDAAGADIALTFHHALADAFSGYRLVAELLGDTPDRAPRLAPSLDDLLPLAGPEQAAAAPRAQRPDVHVRRLAPSREAPPEARTTRLVPLRLSEEATRALVARARAEGTTVQAALCASIVRAVARLEGAGPEEVMRLVSGVNLRGRLAQPMDGVLGMYSSALVTQHPCQGSFWDLARTSKAASDRAAARTGMLYAARALQATPRQPSEAAREQVRYEGRVRAAVGVTNLGRLDVPRLDPGLQLEELHFALGVGHSGPMVMAAATTLNDRLMVNVLYPEPLVSRERAEAIAEAMMAELREASHIP